MTMKDFIEEQSNVIDATLARRGATGRVTGGCVTPEWIRFTVTPALGVTPTDIKEQAEHLAQALGVSELRVSRRGALASVEIRPPDPRPVRLLSFLQWMDTISPLTAALGICDDGAPLLVRLPAADVGSVAVVGEGREELLRMMALSLALLHTPDALRLALIGDGLADLARLPHTDHRATTAGTWEALQHLADLVDTGRVTPPLVAFVADLDAVKRFGKEATAVLRTLLRKGPARGIYLVAGSPDSPRLPFGPRIRNEHGKWVAHTVDGWRWRFFPATVTPEETLTLVDSMNAQHQALPLPALAVGKGATYG